MEKISLLHAFLSRNLLCRSRWEPRLGERASQSFPSSPWLIDDPSLPTAAKHPRIFEGNLSLFAIVDPHPSRGRDSSLYARRGHLITGGNWRGNGTIYRSLITPPETTTALQHQLLFTSTVSLQPSRWFFWLGKAASTARTYLVSPCIRRHNWSSHFHNDDVFPWPRKRGFFSGRRKMGR